MAAAVDRALVEGRHALLEAGTGVGKSYAYLVPLLRHAAEQDVTVAVATSTIALQEQLVRKDLPLLQRALPFDVSFTLVKGRGNYLCRRRLDLALDEEQGTPDLAGLGTDEPVAQLRAIAAWAGGAHDGSRQGLPFRARGDVWDRVRAESGNCLGRACRHYEGCAYQASRRAAHEARLLVLNHHVLMADLALRRSGATFLPDIGALVVDEAHDLEDTACRHLGARVSAGGVRQVLGRLWSGSRRRGLLGDPALAELRRDVAELRTRARHLFERLAEAIQPRSGGVRGLGPDEIVEEDLSEGLLDLAGALDEVARSIQDPGKRLEVQARVRTLRDLSEGVQAIARGETAGQVRWIESSGGDQSALCQAPVDVAPALREVLFEAVPSVVLVSATLASGDPPSFGFVRDRLGVPQPQECRIGSPFDYATQVRMVVRGDLPDPGRDAQRFEDALPAAILEAVRRTDGGALVLFTSVRSLERAADRLAGPVGDAGWDLLVQGRDLERPALLEAFRETSGVLLGLASFWQGVDVPGHALRHVVITRLPFEVPTHPLQVARHRLAEERGGDAFRDVSLPLAALRLRQGFGRLIRRRDDRGMVTLLDPRLLTRRYGAFLLASLPPCEREIVRPDAG
jgi:ATP-dependent DNA helicase DinG